jgi:hypothetical protein
VMWDMAPIMLPFPHAVLEHPRKVRTVRFQQYSQVQLVVQHGLSQHSTACYGTLQGSQSGQQHQCILKYR